MVWDRPPGASREPVVVDVAGPADLVAVPPGGVPRVHSGVVGVRYPGVAVAVDGATVVAYDSGRVLAEAGARRVAFEGGWWSGADVAELTVGPAGAADLTASNVRIVAGAGPDAVVLAAGGSRVGADSGHVAADDDVALTVSGDAVAVVGPQVRVTVVDGRLVQVRQESAPIVAGSDPWSRVGRVAPDLPTARRPTMRPWPAPDQDPTVWLDPLVDVLLGLGARRTGGWERDRFGVAQRLRGRVAVEALTAALALPPTIVVTLDHRGDLRDLGTDQGASISFTGATR